MHRRTFLSIAIGGAFALTGCTTDGSADGEPAAPSPEASTAIESPSVERTETSSPETSSDHRGPNPIGDLNPRRYSTIEQTQQVVSLDLPTVELPDEYEFARAAVARSNDTANTNEEYVALIYANRSNDSATDWAVVYVVSPSGGLPSRIGKNVSIGNRTGVYYGNQNEGHLHFVCGGSEYEVSGPFTRKQLMRIARSICTGK